MKIAIVCYNLGWQSGGPRLIFSSARGLMNAGHEVVIYTPEFKGEFFKELWQGLNIKVVPPVSHFRWDIRPKNIFEKILRKIQQEKLHLDTARRIADAMDSDFNVVNVHDFSYLVAYFYLRKNPRAKVLWTENDPPYMYLPKENYLIDFASRVYNYFKDLAARKYFRAIDRVLVLDSYNQVWCERRGLNVSIVRLGVDAQRFYLPVKDFSIKARSKKVRLFSLGSLNKYRRYEDIILSVALLRAWGYDASALIIASDMWDEKTYREKLYAIVKENQLATFINIRFQGVPEDGLRAAYRESDVFVYSMYLPPPRNGFGFSIGVFEAMAAGLLVILCRTTTATEVLEDGKTALFIDPMSPQQIAEKVRMLIDKPEDYLRIAKSGQEFVRQNMSWEKYAEKFLRLVKAE